MKAETERAAKAEDLATWFRFVAAGDTNALFERTARTLERLIDAEADNDDEGEDEFDEDFDSYSSVDTRFEPPQMPAAANDNSTHSCRRRRR